MPHAKGESKMDKSAPMNQVSSFPLLLFSFVSIVDCRDRSDEELHKDHLLRDSQTQGLI